MSACEYQHRDVIFELCGATKVRNKDQENHASQEQAEVLVFVY